MITATITAEVEDADEAAKIIGATGDDAVIEIPATAPAAIGTVEVTVGGEADAGLKTAVNTEAGTVTAASPAKTTADADELDELVGVATNTSITYTGTSGTITDTITLNANQTLILNGNLTVGSAGSITGDGSLVVASGATVVVEAEGTVDVSGSASSGLIDVTAKYPLSTEDNVNPEGLKNETSVKDLATKVVTITLSGNAGRTITNETVRADFFDDAFTWLIPAQAAKGYSAVVITGLVDPDLSGNIKQSNQGFNMYEVSHLYNSTGYPGNDVYRQRDYKSKSDNGGINDYYPDNIGGFDIILWNGAAKKTIDLEISQPSDATPQKFVIDYSNVKFEAPIITVAEANVYTSADEVLSLATSLTGNVKIGDIPVGIVTNGKLSFTLPETAPTGLSTVSTESGEWANWTSVTISAEDAQVKVWENLDLYSGETKTGKLSFGSYYGPTDGRAFREVKYMYFDKACTISGTYNDGERVFQARKGWNLFHDFGGSIFSDNFDHFVEEFKWVYTAEPETDAGAGGG